LPKIREIFEACVVGPPEGGSLNRICRSSEPGAVATGFSQGTTPLATARGSECPRTS